MFTANQIIAHAVGDYLLQSDWMAQNKATRSVAAALHVFTYTLPFLLLTQSPVALSAIAGSHFLIDRFRLARYVVWLKNCMGRNTPWHESRSTGYPPQTPAWMAVWLLIVADNVLHVLINGLALGYL